MRSLLLLMAVVLVLGCEGGGGPDPKVEAGRLDRARQIRTLFDGAKGDYAALAPADKAEFVKLNGGNDADAEKAWNVMKFGPGAANPSKP